MKVECLNQLVSNVNLRHPCTKIPVEGATMYGSVVIDTAEGVIVADLTTEFRHGSLIVLQARGELEVPLDVDELTSCFPFNFSAAANVTLGVGAGDPTNDKLAVRGEFSAACGGVNGTAYSLGAW